MYVIGVDFDGTIVEHRYPAIGPEMPGAFEVLKELKAAGHKLVLWTCREDFGHNINRRYLTDAVEFCRENGVEFDAVNETIPEHDFRYGETLTRKPHCHYYIDDAIVGGFIGWSAIRHYFFGEGSNNDNQID